MRFECLPGCGLCCSYKVALLQGDVEIIEALGYKREFFVRDGALRKGDAFCVFLDEHKRCSVYDGRPGLCRSFPFHLEDDGSIDVDLSCPGVGRGPEIEPEFGYAAGGKIDKKTAESILDYLPFERFKKIGLHWCNANSRHGSLDQLLQSAREQVRRHNRAPVDGLGSLLDILDGMNTHFTDEGIVTYPFVLRGDRVGVGDRLYPLTYGEMPNEYVTEVLGYLRTWFGRYVFYRFCLACSAGLPVMRPMGVAFLCMRLLAERIAKLRMALIQRWKQDDIEIVKEAIRAIDGRLRTKCRSARIRIIEEET